MLALSISPNRRYLAVSETVQEKPVITIYELSSIPCRKRKILNNFDFPVQRFISMAFSPDSKYLLTQTSPPESNLVYWLWEKQKVMAIIRIDTQSNAIYQVPSSITNIPPPPPRYRKYYELSLTECVLSTRKSAIFITCIVKFSLTVPHKVFKIIAPILQMREPRPQDFSKARASCPWGPCSLLWPRTAHGLHVRPRGGGSNLPSLPGPGLF